MPGMGKAGDGELARIRWRCRRGMRELDELVLAYVERHLARASDAERAAFERLLDLSDPELLDLLLGRAAAAEPATAQVVQRLREGIREEPR